jgi:hypothetical protein
MNEEYRTAVMRMARIVELIQRKERNLQEIRQELNDLTAEAVALRTRLASWHLEGDNELKD